MKDRLSFPITALQLVSCKTQVEDLGPFINLSSRKLTELKTGLESAPACYPDSSLLSTVFFLKHSSVLVESLMKPTPSI